MLPHIKYQRYHRGNIKTHRVKFKISLGTINDGVYFPGWNTLHNIVEEVKNPNVFLREVILRNRFSPGNFPGWIQPGQGDRIFSGFPNFFGKVFLVNLKFFLLAFSTFSWGQCKQNKFLKKFKQVLFLILNFS